MIHKSRKFFTHCFYPLSKKLRFGFVQKNQFEEDLHVLEGKAFLSQKIIDEIEDPQVDLQSKSLRQHLVDMIQSTTEVPQLSREFMRSMFTTGIPIDQNVFNQQRIQDATQKETKKINLFAFCPTRLVTTQMFEGIRKYRSNTLFMGHYGISKSVSFMLYSMLSNIIAEYKFKIYDQAQTKLGEQISESPKIIYYNLESANSFKIQDITNSILYQCSSEIRADERNKFLNFRAGPQETTKFLQRHYEEKNLEVVLVLDQMSKIIGAMQKLKVSPQSVTEYQKQSIAKFKMAYEMLAPEFTRTIFLNSLNAEMGQVNRINGLRLGGNDGHQALIFQNIRYLQKLLINDATKEIIDLFLFELQRKFSTPLLSKDVEITSEMAPQKLKKHFPTGSSTVKLHSLIRDYLSEKLIESEGYLITFYSIRIALRSKNSDQFVFDSIQQLDEFIGKLEDQLNDLIQQYQNEVRKKFDLFLSKQQAFRNLTDQNKYNIIYSLYQSALNFKGEADKNNLYPIDLNNSESISNIQTIVTYIDKTLFRYDKTGLKTLIPPKLLKSVLEPYLKQTVVYFLKNTTEFYKKYITIGSFGNVSESIFVRMIFQCQPTIKLKFNKRFSDQYIFKIENKSIKQMPSIKSSSSNKNSSNISFLNQIFRTSIKEEIQKMNAQMENKQVEYILKDYFYITNTKFTLYTPQSIRNSKTKEAMRNNQNNGRAMDFAIIRILVSEDKIPQVKITVFDITIGKIINELQKKIDGFIEAFKNFEEKNILQIKLYNMKFEISLDFFVLGPKVQMSEIQYIKKYNQSITKQQNKKPMNFKQVVQKVFKQHHLKFDETIDGNSSICKVKKFKHDNRPLLLKHVGYATIGDRLVIESEKEKYITNADSDTKNWRLIENIVLNKV